MKINVVKNTLISFNFQSADYVVETIDAFTTINDCQKHIQAGAKKVIIISPSP